MRSFFVVCLFAAASAAPAADAEADPQLLYPAGLLPYNYGVLPVKTAEVKSVVEKPAEVKVNPVYYNYPLTHVYPYAATHAVHLGKREAEAEPEAEADPWYSYYAGYGYPYYHGYRAYSGFYRPYGYAYWG